MRASSMPKLSWMTLARGARQLVVQEALLWTERQTQSPTTVLFDIHKYKMKWHPLNLGCLFYNIILFCNILMSTMWMHVQNRSFVTWRWSCWRGRICPRWLPWQTSEHQVRGRTQPRAELRQRCEPVIGQERKRLRNGTIWQSVYLFVCVCVCTYVGLVQAEENSGGLDNVLGSTIAPGDLCWLHTRVRERRTVSLRLNGYHYCKVMLTFEWTKTPKY